MCHAIVEVRYRADHADDASTLQRAKDEAHLAELVEQFQSNDHITFICVYRPDAIWERVEEWRMRE